MPINIGNLPIKNIFLGANPIKAVYQGNQLAWSQKSEEVYYTLTLNLEGDYEAFNRDGYTIYVDGNEFARTSSSDIYSIPKGARVSTYNNSNGQYGYEYFESITPTPFYNNDGSWVMDKDYTVNVKAEQSISMVTINIETWHPTGQGFITTQQIMEDGIAKMDTRTFYEQTVLSYTVRQDSNFEILSLYDESHTSFNVYSPDLPNGDGQALFTFNAGNGGTIVIEATSS